MPKEFIIIFVTCASKKEARLISSRLLRKRLAACVNIAGNVDSRFWWHGKIRSAKEVLLMAKTRLKNFKLVEYEVKRIHSYKVPEIIAITIAAGSGNYLKWIDEESY